MTMEEVSLSQRTQRHIELMEKTKAKRWFSETYEDARERFRGCAEAKGGELHTLEIAARGPNDESLTIDIAWFGGKTPKRVMLHSSGLHGVEGFAGSAIQLERLDNETFELLEDEAIIFVHVLNPYGMAWHRRVNESNVDLNRNFLPAGRPYQGASEGYHAMTGVLNPSSPPGFDFFLLRAGAKILRYGYNTLKQAITEGQYVFDKGLFFGGHQLEEGPRKYVQWLENHLSQVEAIFAIDVHTGLGQKGVDARLVDVPTTDPNFEVLRSVFGERIASWDPEASVAYQIHGGHPSMVGRVLPGTKVEFITQEFGTISGLKVLHALREENRWHHNGEGTLSHAAKQGILDAFRPSDDQWAIDVISRGAALYEQVKTHLFTR